METDVKYTIAGVFVIGLVISIILGVLWLSSGFSFELYTTYRVYMQESVSGLNIDSPVEYNGVEVGTVKSIELNHKDPKLVELLLSIKSGVPITQGTVATLNTRGLTGLTFLALKDQGNDLRPLVAKPHQHYPVIKTSPSIFVRLETALTQASSNLHKITESLQSLLDKENLLSIKRTLRHVDQITGTLAIDSSKLDAILTNTAKASQQLVPLLQSSTGTMKALESQTLPATYQVLNRLDEITANLSKISIDIKQNPSVLVRGTSPGKLGPGEPE